MRLILAAAFACVALFFAVPVIAGGSTDMCQDVMLLHAQGDAAGAHMSTSDTMYNVMDSASAVGSTGREARAVEQRQHPLVPPSLSCAAIFWKTL